MALLFVAPVLGQPASPGGPMLRVLALAQNATAALGTQTGETVGGFVELIQDQGISIAVEPPEGAPDRRGGLFRIGAAGVSFALEGSEVEVLLRGDGGLGMKMTLGDGAGLIDVYHDRDTPTLLLEGPGFSLGMQRGAVRILRNAGAPATDVIVIEGRASLIPTGKSGLVLDAAATNRVSVGADGSASAPVRGDGAAAQMTQSRRSLVQSSLIPDLVRQAEAVAEGDIEPPSRGAAIAAVVVAPEVRISEIVPRGTTAARVVSGAQQVGAASAPTSTAEAFIRTGQAALAVVGARLQRTRIVGATGAQVGLQASPEVSRPFNLLTGR